MNIQKYLDRTRKGQEERLKRSQEKARERSREYQESVEKEENSDPIMGLSDNDGW